MGPHIETGPPKAFPRFPLMDGPVYSFVKLISSCSSTAFQNIPFHHIFLTALVTSYFSDDISSYAPCPAKTMYLPDLSTDDSLRCS